MFPNHHKNGGACVAACVAKTSAACVKRVKVPVEPSTEASPLAASLGTSDFCDEKIFDAWIGPTGINANKIFPPFLNQNML